MKILIVHNEYIHRGGEDLCVDREAAALREAGCQIVEFRPQNQAASLLDAAAAPLGGGAVAELKTILLREQPDILHAHNLFPLLSPRIFQWAKSKKIHTLLTLHNYRPLCLNGLFMTPSLETCERCAGHSYVPGVLRGCYRTSRVQSLGLAAHLMLHRNGYDCVDRFIAPSRFLKDKFVGYGFPAQKITVQGHFLPSFPAQAPDTSAPYLLYLGRLSEEKGLRWLLSIFESPQAPIRLKVAGQGPLESLAKRAAEEGRIDFYGYQSGDAKDGLIRQAAALVIPSDCYENFPLVIPEANGWGVPVLAADHGGLHDLVSSRSNGFLYESRDKTSFWNAVEELLRADEKAGFRESIQKRAKMQFDKTSFLTQRMKIYQEVLVAE